MLEQLLEIAMYGAGKARERAVDLLCAAHPAIAERLNPRTIEQSATELSQHVGTILLVADDERERIGRLQSVAAHHVEVAERTLRKMLAELSVVMPHVAPMGVEIDTSPLRAVLEEASRLEPAAAADKARTAA
jgi:hypothetical protein